MAAELEALREAIGQVEASFATPRGGSLLTVVEAARELRVSRSRVFQLLAAGELEGVRIGRARWVTGRRWSTVRSPARMGRGSLRGMRGACSGFSQPWHPPWRRAWSSPRTSSPVTSCPR